MPSPYLFANPDAKKDTITYFWLVITYFWLVITYFWLAISTPGQKQERQQSRQEKTSSHC